MSVTDNTTATANDDIQYMLQRAYDNGLPSDFHEALRLLVLEYEKTFSTGFSPTPSKVTPLRIRLTEDAKPIRERLRNYSPSQREFMSTMIEDCLLYTSPSPRDS